MTLKYNILYIGTLRQVDGNNLFSLILFCSMVYQIPWSFTVAYALR